jgi:hypothetical protein
LDLCCSSFFLYRCTRACNQDITQPRLRISLCSLLSSLESRYALHYHRREFEILTKGKLHTDSRHSFHIFNNHSERVHVFGNQLDYVSLDSHMDRSCLTIVARHRNSHVGFHGTVCVLWLLLYACTTKNPLHSCFGPSDWLRLCHPTSSFPATQVSTLPSRDVCWTRFILYHSHCSWHIDIWLGDTNVENEPRLDGVDDDV